MYNKIFTKILDSSIWMEPTPTRIVWVTMLAAMDEDGFVQFAGIPNLAHRAVLGVEETALAVQCLEAPDANSSDPDNEGRRIERVQGGWIVLNAPKYRELVTREVAREQTRLRVQRFRDKKSGKVTKCNGDVTHGGKVKRDSNGAVTQSEAVSETDTKADSSFSAKKGRKAVEEVQDDGKDHRHAAITSRIGGIYTEATKEPFPANGKFFAKLKTFLHGWAGTADQFLGTFAEVLKHRASQWLPNVRKASDPSFLCDNYAAVCADLQSIESGGKRKPIDRMEIVEFESLER